MKEYLKIVLRNPSKIRHILAITFTNAAASEMKERIIRELGQISALKGKGQDAIADHPLLSQIAAELKEAYADAPGPETIVEHAAIVLKNILHHYADFSVSTIDSFVHRVIRTFSFDLFLPFHFDVELDDSILLDQATELLIARAGRDKQLTDLLIAFIINQADEEKDLRIESLISELGKTLTDEESVNALHQLQRISLQGMLRISANIKDSIRSFDEQVRKHAADAMELIRTEGLDASHFFQSRSGIYSYFDKLLSGQVLTVITPNSYVRRTIEEDKWASGKAGPSAHAAIGRISSRLKEKYVAITGQELSNITTYKTLYAVGKYFYQVALLNELDRVLREVKQENVLLHISDFNKLIASVIMEQPVPFIYERLGERYHHYMIDEFQDTSGLQFQNLLPLIDNSLANGFISLVVGDGKQAIYRFRNGDVEQFARLPELTDAIGSPAKAEWEQTLKANAIINSLDTNYRSHQEVIGFNNQFFSFVAGYLPAELQNIYHDVSQKALPSRSGGYVEINFLDPDACNADISGLSRGAAGSSSGQEAMADGLDNMGYEQLTLIKVHHTIERLTESGHPVRDITILCHSNAKASLIARYLLSKGVPVISSESLLLNQSEEVNFIITFLRLLVDPFDQVAAVDLLGYLLRHGWITKPGSIHECLQIIRQTHHAEKGSIPNQVDAIELLLTDNKVPASFRDFFHLNMYDVCEYIIRVFFSGSREPDPFVAFFSDSVFDFMERNDPSVQDFLAWWDEKGHTFSLVLPDGINAVRIMTIHKSKGLQFPVVIVPFADHRFTRFTKKGQWVEVNLPALPELTTTWVGLNKTDLQGTPFEAAWQSESGKSYLDTLNMVYVAFTRPVEKLFVFSKKTKSFNVQTTNGLLYNFLESNKLWNESQLNYSFGSFTSAGITQTSENEEGLREAGAPGLHVAQTEKAEVAFDTIISQPWNRLLRMKSHQTERSLLSDGDDLLERGNLFHRAMERIHSIHDVEPVLNQMLENGEIDPVRMQEWKQKILEIIKQHEVSPYFKQGLIVKSEAGIYDQHGRFYRPDRIILADEETVIMDYKTGKQYEKHLAQMNQYSNLLQEMGYKNIKKLILYLDENKIKTV